MAAVRVRYLCLAVTAVIVSCAVDPGGANDDSDADQQDLVASFRDAASNTDVLDCGQGAPTNACGGCENPGIVLGTACSMSDSAPTGRCDIPVWQCDSANPGAVICDWLIPETESCDGFDNDCDTLVDEDFDLQNDPEHCGRCDNICITPNAVPGCLLGECAIESCLPGYFNEDGRWNTGCESICIPDSATDDCNGRDNDCDGLVDEDFYPDRCGVGACASTSLCIDGEVVDCTPGEPLAEVEVTCDMIDNDCDGLIDEDIAVPCSNDCGDGLQVCRDGEYPACVATTERGDVCVDIQYFCQTIPLEFRLPLPTPEDELGVDLVFLFDRSVSFRDDLDTFRDKATELTDELSIELADLAVGLSSFIDAPCGSFGYSTDFGFEMNLALTTNLAQLDATLDTLSLQSGRDTPESQLEAMYQTLTGEGVLVSSGDETCLSVADIPPSDQGWRDYKLGFLFVSTDETFHRPDDDGYPYPHGVDDVIAAAGIRGTSIYFLQAAGTTDVDAPLIANETGGAVYELSSDSAEIADTVTHAIFEAISNSEVELRAEGDYLSFVTDIFPERLIGVDLSTNETLDASVSLLSTVNATGEELVYEFGLGFYVNGAEIVRRRVTVSIPAQDPKNCNNRPPVIRELNVQDMIGAGATTTFGVEVEDFDSEPVSYMWEASAGNLAEAHSREATFDAPGVPGIVDVSVTVTDPAGNSDSAQRSILITHGACSQHARFRDLGLTEGRIVVAGELNQHAANGSCGGAGAEALVVLNVHEAGTYRFSVDGDESWNLYVREANCSTELACVASSELEVPLAVGHYLLFVDTSSAQSADFQLYAELLD